MGNAFYVYPEIDHKSLPYEEKKKKKRAYCPALNYQCGPKSKQTYTDQELAEILSETETSSTKAVAKRHGISPQMLRNWRRGINRRKAWTLWQEMKAARSGARF